MDDYDEALTGLMQLMIRNQLSEVLAPVRRRKNITLHEHSTNNLLPENPKHTPLCPLPRSIQAFRLHHRREASMSVKDAGKGRQYWAR